MSAPFVLAPGERHAGSAPGWAFLSLRQRPNRRIARAWGGPLTAAHVGTESPRARQ